MNYFIFQSHEFYQGGVFDRKKYFNSNFGKYHNDVHEINYCPLVYLHSVYRKGLYPNHDVFRNLEIKRTLISVSFTPFVLFIELFFQIIRDFRAKRRR